MVHSTIRARLLATCHHLTPDTSCLFSLRCITNLSFMPLCALCVPSLLVHCGCVVAIPSNSEQLNMLCGHNRNRLEDCATDCATSLAIARATCSDGCPVSRPAPALSLCPLHEQAKSDPGMLTLLGRTQVKRLRRGKGSNLKFKGLSFGLAAGPSTQATASEFVGVHKKCATVSTFSWGRGANMCKGKVIKRLENPGQQSIKKWFSTRCITKSTFCSPVFVRFDQV